MKIIVIGASGTVGRAVAEELSRQHEVIRVGRTQGDELVDITSQHSVQALFEKIGPVDAIVSATGSLYFGPLSTMTDRDFDQDCRINCWGRFASPSPASIISTMAVPSPLSAASSPMNPSLKG